METDSQEGGGTRREPRLGQGPTGPLWQEDGLHSGAGLKAVLTGGWVEACWGPVYLGTQCGHTAPGWGGQKEQLGDLQSVEVEQGSERNDLLTSLKHL